MVSPIPGSYRVRPEVGLGGEEEGKGEGYGETTTRQLDEVCRIKK